MMFVLHHNNFVSLCFRNEFTMLDSTFSRDNLSTDLATNVRSFKELVAKETHLLMLA